MTMLPPLKAELFKYRKRKQLSTDGSTPGAETNRYRPGLHPASPYPYIGRALEGQASRSFDRYYLAGQMFSWTRPSYQQAQSWLEDVAGQSPRGPSARPQASYTAPFVSTDNDNKVSCPTDRILQDMVNEVEAHALQAASDMPPVEQTDVPVPSLPAELASNLLSPGVENVIQAAIEDQRQDATEPSEPQHPWFDAGQMTQDLFDTAMHQAMEQMMADSHSEPMPVAVDGSQESQAALDQPGGPGLEALVQEALPQQDPSEMQPDPYEQERMLYDQQMQQLLNPFMMPGFGPGP